MRYQEIVNLKNELRELRQSLDILKTLSPTPERLQQVKNIEARAKTITSYIREKSRQYGFAA